MTIEQTISINKPVNTVFAIYKDAESWARWDPDLEAVYLDGSFSIGTKGWLKPVGGPRTKTEIVEVSEPHHFAVISRLPFCVMRFDHTLRKANDSTEATHRVSFEGLLAPLFRFIIGKKIQKGIDGTMQGLKLYAESEG